MDNIIVRTKYAEQLRQYKNKAIVKVLTGQRRVGKSFLLKQFINEIATFFFNTIHWKVTHKDLKACNIFVRNNHDFLFLDVEDIRFSSVTPDILRKLFLQLNNSVPLRISSRDRIRFYLRLISLVSVDKKKFLGEIISQSMKEPIVYIGLSGTVMDHWS